VKIRLGDLRMLVREMMANAGEKSDDEDDNVLLDDACCDACAQGDSCSGKKRAE